VTVVEPTRVQITQNFERNLEALEAFWIDAEGGQGFDALLDELVGRMIPNLERFPNLGRLFTKRPVRSVEALHGLEQLKPLLSAVGKTTLVYEDLIGPCVLLYAHHAGSIHLLSIHHPNHQRSDT